MAAKGQDDSRERHVTVQEAGPLTTESGAPVADNQNSEPTDVGGLVLLQDQVLLERHAPFNSEPIPERLVHARGGRRLNGDHLGIEATASGVRDRIGRISLRAVYEAPGLTPSDDHGFSIDETEAIYWGLCPDCSTARSSWAP